MKCRFHYPRFLAALILSASCVYAPVTLSAGKTISPAVFKQLSEVDKLMAAESYTQAISALRQMLPGVDSKAYEKALVLQALSSAYALKGDYRRAGKIMEECLATGALPEERAQRARFNLGQMYLGSEHYQKAVEILEPLLSQADPAPTGQDYMLVANAYTQLKRYKKARGYARKAIAITRTPEEAWYQLLLALHYELHDYRAAAQTLDTLVHRHPNKKDYWQQLASVYYQLKDYKKALAVKELAFKGGVLRGNKDVQELVNLYLHQDAPYKGAKLLEQALQSGQLGSSSKNWEWLANAWTQAREFEPAVAALKKAATLSDKGELYYRLGRIYVEQENWSKAHEALRKALSKGQLNDPGNANILFGMSCYELHFTDRANRAFSSAQRYSKTRRAAQQWLNYIQG